MLAPTTGAWRRSPVSPETGRKMSVPYSRPASISSRPPPIVSGSSVTSGRCCATLSAPCASTIPSANPRTAAQCPRSRHAAIPAIVFRFGGGAISAAAADAIGCPHMTTPSPTALVTGGGSGIGRAVALALVGEGYRVALAGRRPDPLAETIALAGAGAPRALALPADVTRPAEVEALFARIAREWGRLDLLFNNAGASATLPLDELPFER